MTVADPPSALLKKGAAAFTVESPVLVGPLAVVEESPWLVGGR